LKNVTSINASGHKFGLVYPGLGWVMWRNRDMLPDSLVFHVSPCVSVLDNSTGCVYVQVACQHRDIAPWHCLLNRLKTLEHTPVPEMTFQVTRGAFCHVVCLIAVLCV
jgi:hypothetical protein